MDIVCMDRVADSYEIELALLGANGKDRTAIDQPVLIDRTTIARQWLELPIKIIDW